jgi:ribosomal protein S18 acetylase RimI-like enzyme
MRPSHQPATVELPRKQAATAELRRMTSVEFDLWREHAISAYARDTAEASGRSLDATLTSTMELFPRLLPQGVDTAGSWLLKVLDAEGSDVGTLWISADADNPTTAHLYELEIYEGYRGQGWGRAAMTAAERVLSQAGIAELTLEVFGFAERTRRLYDSLGYRVVVTSMSKTLPSGTDRD